MTERYQSIQLRDIPGDIRFEGYYWYSNSRTPVVLQTATQIEHSWFSDLPFVVEANFFAPAERISIQVRNIDGKYVVARIDLNNLDSECHVASSYIGHHLQGLSFEVVEAWTPVADELLENMETLVPAWTAFAGFSTKK